MFVCPTCNASVPELHKKSHIIPEWMYEGCYDDHNRLLSVSYSKETVITMQHGIWGKYWCRECETRSNNPDRYSSIVLANKSPESPEAKAITIEDKIFQKGSEKLTAEYWQGLDFKLFQNFVFVTAIRGELSARTKGKDIMAKKHFDAILDLYRSNEIDDKSYPIVIYRQPNHDPHYTDVSLPFRTKLEGLFKIAFKGPGYLFHLYTTSSRVDESVSLVSLKKDGSIYMPLVPYRNTGHFKNVLEPTKRLLEKYPPSKFNKRR